MANAQKAKTMTKTAKKSLVDWVYEQGGQAQAAAVVGVRTETINRWLHGHIKPRGLSLRRLTELGVNLG